MLFRKCLLVPLAVVLCSCVVQLGVGDREETPLDFTKVDTTQRTDTTDVVIDSVPSISNTAPATSPDAITQLRNDFNSNQNIFNICMLAPKKCVASRITVPNSPWREYLNRLIRDYSAANIRSRKDSGVALVRIDSLSLVDSNTALVNACSYDSMVLVDAGATDSAADDIIFNDAVSSYLSTWVLKMDDGVWKFFSWSASMIKFNVDQCGFNKP
ncbi:MAG: hypothetical protein D4R95_06935 [Actinobacteria bacterium]|nr:MAG: hypothetical protein D4R95_06935 [Actinomycetota bacterium]